jgi:hypothetical protein
VHGAVGVEFVTVVATAIAAVFIAATAYIPAFSEAVGVIRPDIFAATLALFVVVDEAGFANVGIVAVDESQIVLVVPFPAIVAIPIVLAARFAHGIAAGVGASAVLAHGVAAVVALAILVAAVVAYFFAVAVAIVRGVRVDGRFAVGAQEGIIFAHGYCPLKAPIKTGMV